MQNSCDFSIARNCFCVKHSYFTEVGFVLPHIGYIEKGNVTLFFEDYTMSASSGDVIFIPAGVPYKSEWSGTPEIDMYVLESDVDFWKNYIVPVQCISLPELSASFFDLYESVSKGNAFYAASVFYYILGKITERVECTASDKNKVTEKALCFIESNMTKEFSVGELALLCNLSESRFFTVFKLENGYSPIDYKNLMKTKSAIQMLIRDNLSVEDVCERLNFSSPAFFRRILKKFTGKTPSQIKRETSI